MLSFKLRMVSRKLKELYPLDIFIVFPRNISLCKHMHVIYVIYILLQTYSDISISYVNSHPIMYWTIKFEYSTENRLSSVTTRCTYSKWKHQLDATILSVYFTAIVHVSGVTSTHHQECQTCTIGYGITWSRYKPVDVESSANRVFVRL